VVGESAAMMLKIKFAMRTDEASVTQGSHVSSPKSDLSDILATQKMTTNFLILTIKRLRYSSLCVLKKYQ